MVGDRRMRVRRRLERRRVISPVAIIGIIAVVALVAIGVGTYLWWPQPTLPSHAVVAAGGFQARANVNHTITVALEIRNTTDTEVTVIGARLVAPSGLSRTAMTILPPGERNQNLALDGDLPPLAPVTLGVNGIDRNAIVAARFTVICEQLPATSAPTGEQIFVTVRVGDDQREEELTSPVVGTTPWLTATARTACRTTTTRTDPAPSQLPPLPGPTTTRAG